MRKQGIQLAVCIAAGSFAPELVRAAATIVSGRPPSRAR
jgi:hypothetical protein